MTMVKIDEDADVLLCPKCGGNNLHHATVSVFVRSGEDQASTVTTIGSESLAINLDNPSDRRDGIRIMFSCENCDLSNDLTIVQHKGCTHVRWDE